MVALIADPGKIAGAIDRRTPRWPSSPEGRINVGEQIVFDHHRSGWAYALSGLRPLHHNDGVLFCGSLEDAFAWYLDENVQRGVLPFRRPWVGVLHDPPSMSAYLPLASSPERILANRFLRESLPHCRGLFVLSEHLRQWLAPQVKVPVCVLTHPTETPALRFSFDAYRANAERAIVQIGWFLRRTFSIQHLPVTSMRKVWLVPTPTARNMQLLEARCHGRYDEHGVGCVGRYEEWDRIANDAYDRLLSQNIAFLHLYDSSANNAIVECLVRETPLLVNPLPAVVEHLGAGYPLYFRDLDEAAEKAQDESLVRHAHDYLRALDKTRFTLEHFRQSVERSPIYRSLPPARTAPIVEVRARPPVDALPDLNIVSGAPLENRYVFVVCFRNAAGKIGRCLRSVLRQDRARDYGVVVVDDASTDTGRDEAAALLREHAVPHVVVANAERRFYARNLYNAVNLLVRSPDSVVVEVDGDDYLEDTDVLRVLDDAYDHGALRTFGTFRCVGDEQGLFPADIVSRAAYDMSRPWDLDACHSWMPLKNFRKSLFMRVPLEYFWERQGQAWLRQGDDKCVHPKLVELAGNRCVYIDRVLYVYDLSGDDHIIKQPDNARYLVENLHRVPVGRFIGECYESVRASERLKRGGARETKLRVNEY